jgi:hypothetical protein
LPAANCSRTRPCPMPSHCWPSAGECGSEGHHARYKGSSSAAQDGKRHLRETPQAIPCSAAIATAPTYSPVRRLPLRIRSRTPVISFPGHPLSSHTVSSGRQYGVGAAETSGAKGPADARLLRLPSNCLDIVTSYGRPAAWLRLPAAAAWLPPPCQQQQPPPLDPPPPPRRS